MTSSANYTEIIYNEFCTFVVISSNIGSLTSVLIDSISRLTYIISCALLLAAINSASFTESTNIFCIVLRWIAGAQHRKVQLPPTPFRVYVSLAKYESDIPVIPCKKIRIATPFSFWLKFNTSTGKEKYLENRPSPQQIKYSFWSQMEINHLRKHITVASSGG